MNIEDEYRYETTIEKIIFNLEQLIADILLASIKRLSGEYEDTILKMNKQNKEEEPF